MKTRIPKIIHYCWFGGKPKPQLILNCIESWKKYCPDYRIIEWNEDNFDIHSCAFVEEAYKAQKWAFVSDCVRAFVLYQYGGIYVDTDYELLKPLDSVVCYSAFAGFEVNDTLGSAIMGFEKNNDLLRQFYDFYNNNHYRSVDDEDFITSPMLLTALYKERGLRLNGKKQMIDGSIVLSKRVFFPTGLGWVFGKYGKKTVGIHHFMDSWGRNSGLSLRSFGSKLRLCMLYHVRNVLGTHTMYVIGKKLRNR